MPELQRSVAFIDSGIFQVPDLTIHEQMIFIVIQANYDRQYDDSEGLSYQFLARKGRISRKSVIKAVHSLVEKGLLQKKEQVGTSNQYILSDPCDFIQADRE